MPRGIRNFAIFCHRPARVLDHRGQCVADVDG